MAGDSGLNSPVSAAGKYAAPMAAENCTSCRKSFGSNVKEHTLSIFTSFYT